MQKQNSPDQASTPAIRASNGLRLPNVKEKIKMSRAWIYERIRQGTFPAPIKFGHSSIWIESEVDQWMAEQIKKSRSPVSRACDNQT